MTTAGSESVARYWVVIAFLAVAGAICVFVVSAMLLTPIYKFDTDCGSVLNPFFDHSPRFCSTAFVARRNLALAPGGGVLFCCVGVALTWRAKPRSRSYEPPRSATAAP